MSTKPKLGTATQAAETTGPQGASPSVKSTLKSPAPKAAAPKVTWTHDWVSVRLGNNRGLSASFGGTKATGAVPMEVFNLWAGVVEFKGLERIGLKAEPKPTLREVVEAFVADIDRIWPGWSTPPKVPPVGARVQVDMGKRKGVVEGEVVSVRATMLTVRFPAPHGLLSLPADMAKEVEGG